MPADDQLALFLRVLLAAGIGAFIGIERELRGYPAGVRTMALVALGSALFTEISLLTGTEDRIAAGIVTGIGFLGAGVIFREGYTIKGITTAATVWSAAAIGMAVSRRLYLAAGLSSLLIFLLPRGAAARRGNRRFSPESRAAAYRPRARRTFEEE